MPSVSYSSAGNCDFLLILGHRKWQGMTPCPPCVTHLAKCQSAARILRRTSSPRQPVPTIQEENINSLPDFIKVSSYCVNVSMSSPLTAMKRPSRKFRLWTVRTDNHSCSQLGSRCIYLFWCATFKGAISNNWPPLKLQTNRGQYITWSNTNCCELGQQLTS